MIDSALLTAADYLALLEEGDRWIELVRGRLVRLTPPDEIHGNAVRNLSMAISQQFRREPGLYACYELGLVIAFGPDTVRLPAISCFRRDGGLGELDRLTTERCPELVIEVASSNDRRDAMAERIRGYLEAGVRAIWVFDPESQHAHVFLDGETPKMLKENETLVGFPVLPGFSIEVGAVFAEPRWAAKS